MTTGLGMKKKSTEKKKRNKSTLCHIQPLMQSNFYAL